MQDDSDIASSLLKRAEIYPDSVDDNDRITFEYNRQGQITETRDQQGTVHAFDFDALGRKYFAIGTKDSYQAILPYGHSSVAGKHPPQ